MTFNLKDAGDATDVWTYLVSIGPKSDGRRVRPTEMVKPF